MKHGTVSDFFCTFSFNSFNLQLIIISTKWKKDFTYIPEVIANLQANLLYWKECADTQDLNQFMIPRGNLDDMKLSQSIIEDNESEISDENKGWYKHIY